jgi:hypothetical protein
MNASVRDAAAKIVRVWGCASVAGAVVGADEAPQAVKKMENKRVRDNCRFILIE